MDTRRTCKECGADLPAGAPEGLCPKCLLKAGIATQPPAEPGSAPSSRKPEDALPDPAKLAGYFPQLEILELLGQGGMGAVYKARQPALDRVVALKILSTTSAPDAGFAERFLREARALAKLSHPNIVAVYDFGQTHGLHYFIMEFVDGPNLRQIEQAGKLSARQALQIIPQVCEALQFAHDEGVVHRDIKPENVLLDKKGRVKIADFGLAKILGLESKALRLTGAKDFMGTPHYMAPEQVENPRQVDHRADIYSLGVVFYEMLTGELPLGRFAPPSQKVQVDVRLDEVVLHALEKEPQRRYQHASEVKTDVESIASRPAPVTTPPLPQAVPPTSATRPEFWKTAIGVLAIVIALILVGLILESVGKTMARRAAADQATLTVTGVVTDAATGKPIAGARVSDNRYGAGAGRAPQETSGLPVPPVVIKTFPESGSSNVDPALTEIQATFSAPMKDGCWSWTTWSEESFPEITGNIHYLADGRTCVLPVKLKPGRVYSTWINSEDFQNFQDREGRPAVPYLLIFKTRSR